MSIPVSKCQELGASLILPRNEQEHKDLFPAVQSLAKLNDVIALDGSDVTKEGAWVDSTGHHISYFNWNFIEPNGGRKENRLNYWLGLTSNPYRTPGSMNDYTDDIISTVICSKTVANKHDLNTGKNMSRYVKGSST